MKWTTEVRGVEIPIEATDTPGDTVLILGHGAGSNMDHKTVLWLSCLAQAAGLRTVRFNFLYRAQGKSMPDRMPTMVETYRAVVQSVREKLGPQRLLLGGHSMGGRVASHVLAEAPSFANGLILFGYPLHPAGKPESLRVDHLSKIQVPTLQMNGDRDDLCTPALMETALMDLKDRPWHMHWIAGADHSYAVTKATGRTRAQVEQEITSALASWLSTVRPASP